MAEPACPFCLIATGKAPADVVWSDAEHLAFLDARPITSGHLLLIPRIHMPTVFDLEVDAYNRLFERVRSLAGPVARAAGAPRTGIAIEGFRVAHAHVHLVPLWRGGDLDPCRQAPSTEEERRATAVRLRIGPRWRLIADRLWVVPA